MGEVTFPSAPVPVAVLSTLSNELCGSGSYSRNPEINKILLNLVPSLLPKNARRLYEMSSELVVDFRSTLGTSNNVLIHFFVLTVSKNTCLDNCPKEINS